MQRRAVETSHKALAAEVAKELAAQSVATPAQQIIREHHQYFIVQPPPITPIPGPTVTDQARHTGKSVHEQFLAPTPASSSTDIPITYFPKPIASTEFPMEMQQI